LGTQLPFDRLVRTVDDFFATKSTRVRFFPAQHRAANTHAAAEHIDRFTMSITPDFSME